MKLAAPRFRLLALVSSLGLVVFSAGPAWGQVMNILAQYNFSTAPTNGLNQGNDTARTGPGYEAQITDPNVIALDLHISDSVPDTYESWIELYPGGHPDNYGHLVFRFIEGNSSTNPYEAIANNRYIEMSLSAAGGGNLVLDNLNFNAGKGGAAARGYVALAFDANGIATFLDTQDVTTVRPQLSNYTVDLSGLAKAPSWTLRIYIYTPGRDYPIDFDAITIYGIVQ